MIRRYGRGCLPGCGFRSTRTGWPPRIPFSGAAQSSEPRRHDGQMVRGRPRSPLRSAACFRPLPFRAFLKTSVSPRRTRAGGRPVGRGDQVTAEGEEVVVAGTGLGVDKDLPVCRCGVTHVGMRSPTSLQRHSRVRHTEVAEVRHFSTPLVANLLPEKRIFPHYRRCSSAREIRQIDREGTSSHALMAPRPLRHVLERVQHLNCQCCPSVPRMHRPSVNDQIYFLRRSAECSEHLADSFIVRAAFLCVTSRRDA